MVTLVASNVSLDMLNLPVAEPSDGWDYQNLTSIRAKYFGDASNFARYDGSGLTYNAAGDFVGGTIDQVVLVRNGLTNLKITGMSVDAETLRNAMTSGVVANVWNAVLGGADLIRGSALNDKLLGEAGNDRIYGNGGNDHLYGDGGADKLFGGAGSDALLGGKGNDRLDGGGGVDYLIGDAGRDTFIFRNAPGPGNIDGIMGFVPADDTIELESAIFTAAGPTGTLAASRFYSGAPAHDASDRIIYDPASGFVTYDDDGNGPHVPVQFVQLNMGLTLTAADFLIV